MFAVNAGEMINVGIAGNPSAVDRHMSALKNINDIRIVSVSDTTALKAINAYSYAEITDKILADLDAMILTDSDDFSSQLAIDALRRAKHVFLYPAVLRSINEAPQLIKLAREANVILKCGKTGKFGIDGMPASIPEPNGIGMIEFQHIIKMQKTPAMESMADILLADIEIIVRLIPARITSLKAKGLGMFTAQPDIMNARLEFDNGSAVNYYCNRVGTRNEHGLTVMLRDSVLRYNLLTSELSGWYINRIMNQNENPIFIENIQVKQPDHPFDDLSGFFNLIRSGPAFLSIYDNGFESFVLTDRILEKVSKTLVQFA